MSKKDGSMTWAYGEKTEQDARASAEHLCRKNFDQCEEWVTRYAKCVAIYKPLDEKYYSIGFGDNALEASNAAEKNCSEKGNVCLPHSPDKLPACDTWR
jgi:hypothetical protein